MKLSSDPFLGWSYVVSCPVCSELSRSLNARCCSARAWKVDSVLDPLRTSLSSSGLEWHRPILQAVNHLSEIFHSFCW